MNFSDLPSAPLGCKTIRAGCLLAYEVQKPTAILLLFKPRPSPAHTMIEERMACSNGMPPEYFSDAHHNRLFKTLLLPGMNEYRYDALFSVHNQPADTGLPTTLILPQDMPVEVFRYTLPSRYCESDKLAGFAHQLFGYLPAGIEQVRAICHWTHTNIEYRYGTGSGLLSACDIIARGYGVCRDFAHVMIALCRALDIPARYVAAYMPYVGVAEGDIGVDFHAYCEVFLGGCWHSFDARYNKSHPVRLKIAHGLDAVDAAFATIYGEAAQVQFQVWAYELNAAASLDQPVAIVKDERGMPLLLE